MATRFVYIPITEKPYVKVVSVDFIWEKGMSLAQRVKSSVNLSNAILKEGLATRVLECSRAGLTTLGVGLSAFNLPYYENGDIMVENVYQGSKVFKDVDTGNTIWLKRLYDVSPMEAKCEPILNSKNYELVEFRLGKNQEVFAPNPRLAFFNYIYIKSLMCHLDLHLDLKAELLSYDGFTDVMLKWYKGEVTSCQAHAIAMYVGMYKSGVLAEYMNNKEKYLELFT